MAYVIYTMLHQRTPVVLILPPCKYRVGVEALHVPPCRKEVCRFAGCEQNKSRDCVRFNDSFEKRGSNGGGGEKAAKG